MWEVAILYSSSQNSLGIGKNSLTSIMWWSQSFIHQVRILSGERLRALRARQPEVVAILYSSSQNSLSGVSYMTTPSDQGRNPLFIKSEFSLRDFKDWAEFVDYCFVAILYSSSQNSLAMGSASERVRLSVSRNPLFIKSEFSPSGLGFIFSKSTP